MVVGKSEAQTTDPKDSTILNTKQLEDIRKILDNKYSEWM